MSEHERYMAMAAVPISDGSCHVPPLYRFLSRMDVSTGSECIFWKGKLGKNGYAKLSIGDKDMYAHRFSYTMFVGPIPEGMRIDHECRNRNCVNPSHLRLVTHRENCIYNSSSTSAMNLVKTHCKNGHEFTPENTIMIRPETPGAMPSRRCRECKNRRDREYRAKTMPEILMGGGLL